MMKNLTVYLYLEPYLQQWLRHSLGEPVRFPPQSYENHLLRNLLQRTPTINSHHTIPYGRDAQCIAVVIPDNAHHRPEYYHHLSRRAHALMVRAIESLFRIHLWSDLSPIIYSHQPLNQAIDEWCEQHNIDIDYREGVRQKFYRMRRSYEAYGIILGKKKCHKRG